MADYQPVTETGPQRQQEVVDAPAHVEFHGDHKTDDRIIPGVVTELGALPHDAVVTEESLAHLFDRHPTSVKRAVERGELPPPCRLFGSNSWTVGSIVKHINTRLEEAASEAKRLNEKVAQLRP